MKIASPKKRSRETTTRKLFEAGISIFSKCGYEAATTKQIAKCAGMNEALIARYFKGKAGLLQSIIVDYITKNKEEARNFPFGKTLEEDITNFMTTKLSKIMGNRDFDRIILSQVLTDPKLSRDVEYLIYFDEKDPILERLRHYQAKGDIAPDRNLKLVAQYLHNQTLGLLFMGAVVTKLDCDHMQKSICALAFDLSQGLKQPLPQS